MAASRGRPDASDQMIHYHGTPLTPHEKLLTLAGVRLRQHRLVVPIQIFPH